MKVIERNFKANVLEELLLQYNYETTQYE